MHLRAAVAWCTPLLAAASWDRKTSLLPSGVNLGLMALSRPSVRQWACGFRSEVVLFLQVKGTLTLYREQGRLRQYTMPRRCGMVGKL